ncbi:Toll/IL-receptor-like protein [Brazilian porcupinepox virus 1]|nr:Toll/IL-receptor-like protein [Brazilian porcupinepox virus 1]
MSYYNNISVSETNEQKFSVYLSVNNVKDDALDVETINDYCISFSHDLDDEISENCDIKEIIEEYMSWRSLSGKLGVISMLTGKVYRNFNKFDEYAFKMLGDLEILSLDILKLNVLDKPQERLFNFLSSLEIDFTRVDNFIILLGLFGYMSEFWGRCKLQNFIPDIVYFIFTNINDKTILDFKKKFKFL